MNARGKANPKFFSTKSAVLKQQICYETKMDHLSYRYPLYRTQRLYTVSHTDMTVVGWKWMDKLRPQKKQKENLDPY